MMICNGCANGYENQLAHLDGCLKSSPLSSPVTNHTCIRCVRSRQNQFLFEITLNNTSIDLVNIQLPDVEKYAYFKAIMIVVTRYSYRAIDLTVDSREVYDILCGRCHGKIPPYTYYLSLKDYITAIRFKTS